MSEVYEASDDDPMVVLDLVPLTPQAVEMAITRLSSAPTLAILGRVKTDRRKTSFEVDFAKVDEAKRLLGTKTLTDTVDAALDEVMALEQRRQLTDLLFADDGYDLDDPEVMSGAWR